MKISCFIILIMGFIKYKNKTVNFFDNGEGQALVFLHGYLESLKIWQEFTNSLKNNYRIITIDLPGHGESENIDNVHSMELMADVVNSVLEYLSVLKCVMIGHSMGGYVVLEFANKYQNKLLAYSLFHSHPFADTEEKKINRKREIELIKKGKKEIIFNTSIPNLYFIDNHKKLADKINFSIDIALNMSDESIISAMNGMIYRQDRLQTLENNKLPVLMIIGYKDNLISSDTLKKIADNNEHIDSCILLKSAHMGFYEEPKKSLFAIKEFIKKTI